MIEISRKKARLTATFIINRIRKANIRVIIWKVLAVIQCTNIVGKAPLEAMKERGRGWYFVSVKITSIIEDEELILIDDAAVSTQPSHDFKSMSQIDPTWKEWCSLCGVELHLGWVSDKRSRWLTSIAGIHYILTVNLSFVFLRFMSSDGQVRSNLDRIKSSTRRNRIYSALESMYRQMFEK